MFLIHSEVPLDKSGWYFLAIVGDLCYIVSWTLSADICISFAHIMWKLVTSLYVYTCRLLYTTSQLWQNMSLSCVKQPYLIQLRHSQCVVGWAVNCLINMWNTFILITCSLAAVRVSNVVIHSRSGCSDSSLRPFYWRILSNPNRENTFGNHSSKK